MRLDSDWIRILHKRFAEEKERRRAKCIVILCVFNLMAFIARTETTFVLLFFFSFFFFVFASFHLVITAKCCNHRHTIIAIAIYCQCVVVFFFCRTLIAVIVLWRHTMHQASSLYANFSSQY